MCDIDCGDCALTRAINDAGIPLKDNSKILHKDALAEIPSGPGKKGSWCEPIVSMHHMTSSVVNDVWQFERKMEDLDVCTKFQNLIRIEDHIINKPV